VPHIYLKAAYVSVFPEFWYYHLGHKVEFQSESSYRFEMWPIEGKLDDEGYGGLIDKTRIVFWKLYEISRQTQTTIDKIENCVHTQLLNKGQGKIIPGTKDTRSYNWIDDDFWRTIQDLREDLDSSCLRLIAILMWRAGLHCGPSVLKSDISLVFYSSDSEEWKQFPTISNLGLPDGFFSPDTVSKSMSSVKELFDDGVIAPIHHSLFQEAWQIRYSAPRVACVMSIVSVETAIKSLISELLPQTAWLIENLQSPPIVKIVRELFEFLPVRCGFTGTVKRPPKGIISALGRGVELRNQIVHGRKVEISSEQLQEILKAVRDMLWIIDYYSGHHWAEDFVSEEVRREME
jgi:hypothetical protein